MTILLASPPEPLVCSQDSTDVKDSGDFTSDSPDEVKRPVVLIAAVQEDEPIVTRKELWSYYLYYNGDNSAGPVNYAQTLFQSLATSAGYDPVAGPGSSCLSSTASGQCVLPWMGGTKPVASIVLVANGISFALVSAIFTTISSAADYGTSSRWILLIFTVTCWVSQYTFMAATSPDDWKLAMGLFIVGVTSCGASLALFTAAFPRLARNTPHSRSLREMYEKGLISVEEYEKGESLEKNRISNISTIHSNIGLISAYLLNLGLLLAPKTAHDPKVDNYVLVLCNSYWVLLGIWWFIFQLPRPGPPLPKGESYLTIGWKQIWFALKTYKHLPYTFAYLFAYFFLSDGFNTTIILIAIIQNEKFNFSFLRNSYLGFVQGITMVLGTLGFWCIQRYWKIRTKTMFFFTVIVTVLIPLWGMIGIWTDRFGFHNTWEYWAYNIVAGLLQGPYYAYSQTMMAELSPPGFDYMFFGLFNLSNRASSAVGPYVVQAIIDTTHNNWEGFTFLFSICMASALVIWFGVDVEKGRRDAVRWAAAQRS